MWDWTGISLECSPAGEKTPQVDIPGPKSRRSGGDPHWFGMTAWSHLTNGQDICPPLCGLDTEQ